MPALGFSLFLVTIGAIFAFAVTASISGLNLAAVGVILMLVGLFGIGYSLLFWTSFAPFRRRETIIHDDVIHDDDVHVHHLP